MDKKVNIIIVDDHEMFRSGLKLAISKLKFAEITGEASNGKMFLELLNHTPVDIVLMDIKMPEMNGIEATLHAVKKYPKLKIVALSMFGDEEYLHNMIDAGAVGFMLKNIQKNELELAIRLIAEGKNYFSEELLSFFTNSFLKKTDLSDNPNLEKISKREIEVLKMIAEGYSNAEIADKLCISQRTVDGHKSNLIAKTGSKNIVHLLVYAIKNKLIEV